MKAFLRSPSGRVLLFAFAVAFVGTGVSKLVGADGAIIGNASVFAGAAMTVYALATSIDEHFGAAALTAVMLPMLTLLAEVEQQKLTAASGIALVAVGLAGVGFALRPAPSAAEPQLAPARAH